MEYTLKKHALERIADDLRGYYNDMEWSRSEIARGCYQMQEESFRLQRAMLRIEVAKTLFYDMGIRCEWDGEKIKLFNTITNEQIA